MVRIAVIEDEAPLLSNIIQMLQFEGFEAVGASTGIAGVELIRETLPDIVLCDIMLPEMDGFEVLQELHQDMTTALIPFIFLTARDSREDMRRGMELGADDYISKPFSTVELLVAIRTRLERHTQSEHQRLRTLLQRLLEIQEKEHQQIAYELQNEIGHLLAGLKVLLTMSRRLPEEGLRNRLDEAGTLVEDILERIKALSLDLNPPLLNDLGLLPTLLQYFKQYTAQTQVQVIFRHRNLDRRFPPEYERTTFRIVQEALSNAACHTQVNQVEVQLWVDEDKLYIQIEDQGKGFNVETTIKTQAASALSRLYEWTILLGGQFTIASAPGVGTQISAQFPLKDDFVAPDVQPVIQEPKVPAARPRSSGSIIKIVLADSYDLTRKGLRSLIEEEPDFLIAGEATSAHSALALIKETKPDVLILDSALAWEVVAQLDQNTFDTHILMLSTHTEEAYVLEALRKGITGYALKESSMDELVQAVRDVAVGRRYLSPMLSKRAIEAYMHMQHDEDKTFDEHGPLSNREHEILLLIVKGARTSTIADMLSISPRTVETHRANLMRKLGLRNQAELVRYAIQHGLAPLDNA